MYKLVIWEDSTEKDFANLKSKFSNEVWVRMLNFLSTTPHLGKKEMQFKKYDLPDACRILYLILSEKEGVRIVCAGNHDKYTRFLNKYGKKK